MSYPQLLDFSERLVNPEEFAFSLVMLRSNILPNCIAVSTELVLCGFDNEASFFDASIW